jgi:hypothetical protein
MVWVPVALVLLLPYAMTALWTGAVKFSHCPNYPWFYYALGLAISFVVGVVVLCLVGFRRLPAAESPTVAAGWPRGKLFLVWCVVLVLHAATIQNLSNAASQQIAALREESKRTLEAAVPASAAESENALPLYEEAAEAFQCWNGSQQSWFEKKAASFDSKDPQLLAFMREREPAARLLQAAARRPACVFRADPRIPCRTGASLLEPVLGQLPLFLTVHCRCKLAEGNRPAAWQDVYTLFQFARHLREQLWINTSGEARHIEKQAIQALQYVLADAQPTAEQLAGVQIDEFFSWQRSMRDFFPVEAASGLWFLTLPEASSAEELQYFGFHFSPAVHYIFLKPGLYRIFFFPIDLAFYRRLAMNTEIGLAWPYYEARKLPFYIEDRKTLRNPVNVGAIVTTAFGFGPGFVELPKACAKADARHATAVVALAVARYQAKHGQFPKQLEDLVPEFLAVVPRDPFDGKPIKYQDTDSGVTIFSVGRDTVDENDVYGNRPTKPEKGDMTFTLPRWKR